MMGPEDHGIQVLCSSGGWFPKPWVQWRDTAGEKLLSLSESQTQDGDGLFHVEASLVVTDSSLGNVTCSIQNPVSGQEKASAIFLPGQSGTNPEAELGVFQAGRSEGGLKGALERGRGFLQVGLSLCLHMPVSEPFFPRTSPWKTALAGTLPVLLLLLIGISYTGWREHRAKTREAEKKKEASHERDKVAKEKEEAHSVKSKSAASQIRGSWKSCRCCVCRVDGERKNCSRILRKTQGAKNSTDLGVLCKGENHVGS